MKGDIKNLVKNVLEENIVKFKHQTSNVLYSKLTNRLKQEYVNVSKSMFKNINESEASGPESMYFAADEMMVAPPGRGTGGSGTGPGQGKPKDSKPWPNPGPPPKNPWPNGPGPRPNRDAYTKGSEGDERYLQDLLEWEQRLREIKEYRERLRQWNTDYRRWREHIPTHGPDSPNP